MREGTEINILIAAYFLIRFSVGGLKTEEKLIYFNVLLIAKLRKLKQFPNKTHTPIRSTHSPQVLFKILCNPLVLLPIY
jgi:hypothetical protein